MSSTTPHDKAAHAADHKVEKSVADSFPASDAPSGTTSGSRAVSPEEMMAGTRTHTPDSVTLSRHFPDAESAKLALENLVRAVPLDRDCTEIDGLELRLKVPQDDVARVEDMLMSV